MARDEDFRERRRREQKEELQREAEEARRKRGSGAAPVSGRAEGASEASLEQLMAQAEPLIQQVQQLYHLYVQGIEKLPPREKRQQLEQIMLQLTNAPKPTPALKFRFSGLQASFALHRERWDKLMRDIEDGKIQRKIR